MATGSRLNALVQRAEALGGFETISTSERDPALYINFSTAGGAPIYWPFLVRARRNKKIAHSDYQTLLGGATSALPGPSRQEIDEILVVLRQFMNAIAERFGKTHIFYQASTPDAAAPALLMILKAGLRYREFWNDEGKWLEDLQKSPYFSV